MSREAKLRHGSLDGEKTELFVVRKDQATEEAIVCCPYVRATHGARVESKELATVSGDRVLVFFKRVPVAKTKGFRANPPANWRGESLRFPAGTQTTVAALGEAFGMLEADVDTSRVDEEEEVLPGGYVSVGAAGSVAGSSPVTLPARAVGPGSEGTVETSGRSTPVVEGGGRGPAVTLLSPRASSDPYRPRGPSPLRPVPDTERSFSFSHRGPLRGYGPLREAQSRVKVEPSAEPATAGPPMEERLRMEKERLERDLIARGPKEERHLAFLGDRSKVLSDSEGNSSARYAPVLQAMVAEREDMERRMQEALAEAARMRSEWEESFLDKEEARLRALAQEQAEREKERVRLWAERERLKKERVPPSEHSAGGRSTPPDPEVQRQTYDAMRNRLQAAERRASLAEDALARSGAVSQAVPESRVGAGRRRLRAWGLGEG